MFNNLFLSKTKRVLIFIILYTIMFFLFFSTFSYTFPFVIGFVIAVLTRPLNLYFQRKFKISNTISSLISTILVFSILGFILTMVVLKIAFESKNILANPPDINMFLKYIEVHIDTIKIFYDQIDPAIAQKIYQQASLILSNIFNIGLDLINNMVSFAIGLPVALMVTFITFIATYFLSKDVYIIENKFLSIFSSTGKGKVKNILKEGNRMILVYIRSYAIILSITFIETLIGFTILGVDYTLILSIIAALVDILPVLGVGSVYMPLAVIYFFIGKKFISIGLIILYILVIVIRQIIEPKLVSTSLGISPILILAAIFIGLKAYGFLGMIYLISLIVSHKILTKVDIL